MYFLNICLVLLTLLVFVVKYRRYKWKLIYDVFTWFILYELFYLLIPMLLIEKISLYESWFFTDNTIVKTRICVMVFFLSNFLFYLLWKPKVNYLIQIKFDRNAAVISIAKFILKFSFCITLYVVLQLAILIIRSGDNFLNLYLTLRTDGGDLVERYKIKQLIFLNCVCVFYLYVRNKNFKYFFYFLPYIAIDFLSGSRTNTYIIILLIYLLIVRTRKKSYLLKIGITLLILLVAVLVTRIRYLVGTDFSLDQFLTISFGEFNATFLTTPYIIQNDMIGVTSVVDNVIQLISGIFPSFIKTKVFGDYSIGQAIAFYINRGYGLGSNIVTNALFSYGVLGVLVIPLFITVFIVFMEKAVFSRDQFILVKIFTIVYLRLVVREGMEYFSIIFFLVYFYFLFFIFKWPQYRRPEIVT